MQIGNTRFESINREFNKRRPLYNILYFTIQSLVIVTDPIQFPRSGRLIAGLLLGMIFDEYSLVRISQNKTLPSSLAEAIVSSL
jgi:hypothetical protein